MQDEEKSLIAILGEWPWLTALLIALSAVLFLLVLDARASPMELSRWGLHLNPEGIWEGDLRPLLFAPFVHVLRGELLIGLPWMLLNLYWLWTLGRAVELTLGRQTLFATLFFGALVTSGAQLFFGGWPALGLTGPVLALAGLWWSARQIEPILTMLLRPRVLALLGLWVPLTLLMGLAGELIGLGDVGFFANLAGLLFGFGVGEFVVVRRRMRLGLAALTLLTAITVASVVWAPLAPEWTWWRFDRAFTAGRYQQALDVAEPVAAGEGPLGWDGIQRAQALNAVAWLRATAHDEAFRDGPRAERLAREALRRFGWLEPSFIDTLAAAYAEQGRWAEAEALQLIALELTDRLATHDAIDLPQAYRAELEKTLERIRARQRIEH